MTVAACLKWVDHRADVDPLTGAVRTDPRTSGPSRADQAALAWALQIGTAWGEPVVAVTAGLPAAEAGLRDALAAGASEAVRVDQDPEAPSAAVADALAPVLSGARVVVCGAWSEDRGSGSTPAFLAARLGAVQALGLIGLSFPDAPGPLHAERRLDGGRRERLKIPIPAVVSVEAGTARPPRSTVDAMIRARHAGIDLRPGVRSAPETAVGIAAFRPRARLLAAPAGDDPRSRVLVLTGSTAHRPTSRVVTLPPEEAAAALLDQLRAWGYIK